MYLSILRMMVAISLIATPINPYYGGLTVYLWIFLVFLDIDFVGRLRKVNIKYLLIAFSWITLAFFELHFSLALKLIVLFIGISYLCLMDEEIFPKLRIAFIISCIFCMIQFCLYFINPVYSASIAGENIGKFIWGEALATPAYVNQYVVFLFPRMAGLSREAGFFASLLVIMVLIILSRKKIKYKEAIFYILAYVFSLSKVSLSGFLLLLIFPFRKFVDKIPMFISILVSILFFMYLAYSLNIGENNYVYNNESMAHRLSSSYIVPKLNDKEFFIGCGESITKCVVNPDNQLIRYFSIDGGLEPNTGINGIWVIFGFLGVVLFLFTIYLLNFKSFDLIVMLLVMSTVTFMTMDNFVILTYYYLLTYRKYNKRIGT